MLSNVRVEATACSDGGIVVATAWKDEESSADAKLFQALRLRDGKIVEMQDYGDHRTALSALGKIT